MKSEIIKFDVEAVWRRPKAQNGEPYHWGMAKGLKIDDAWSRKCVIYRWIRGNDDRVAVVGESERTLSARVTNYTTAKEDGKAGSTNKRVFRENQKLNSEGTFLYLEYLLALPGFNFDFKHERRAAEGLLTAFYKPYIIIEEGA